MFQFLEKVRTPAGVHRRWVRETATKLLTANTYEEAQAIRARLMRDPWRKVSIVSMRRPGEIAALHAQHLADAADARKLRNVTMAKEALSAARAVRIGMA